MDLYVVGLPYAQEHGETEEVTEQPAHGEENPLFPEFDELLFGSLAFLLVFIALAKFAFPKLNTAMQARTDKIQGDLEKAEEGRREAEALLARYEEQLRDARGESGRIIEEARKTADSMRRDMLAKAEEEARQVVARAQEEIRAERDRAFEELRSSVGELSVELASRVIGANLDRQAQGRLVDEYIDELTQLGNGNGGGGA